MMVLRIQENPSLRKEKKTEMRSFLISVERIELASLPWRFLYLIFLHVITERHENIILIVNGNAISLGRDGVEIRSG